MWRELSLGLSGPWSPARESASVGWRDGQPVSLAAWLAEASGWAAAFAELPGEDLALHFHDALSAGAALFAAWHVGKRVWWPGDALPATAQQLAHLPCAGDWPTRPDALRAQPAAREPLWQPLDPQWQAVRIFTSGSTGEPLALPKRLSQLFDEVRSLESTFGGLVGEAEVQGTVSHQHIYGLLFRLLWPLAAGRPLIAHRVAYVEDLAVVNRPMVLIASPAHLKRLDALPAAPAQLRAVFSSGGPLPGEAVLSCAQHLGTTPIEVYGSSETGGVAWRQRAPGSDDAYPWRALPGVDWRLDGERLLLRSPHLGSRDEWFEAADLARAEGQGFALIGRADRIVKIEEKRVSLAAIEAALMATGQVQALRLLPLPGRRQELGVVLVPKESAWPDIEAQGRAAWLKPLRDALVPLLDPTVRPRRWRLVSALPANAQGKVTQAALQALFDPLRPPARLLASDAASAHWQLEVEAQHPGFDGHFPGHPVLPGVVQLDWVERFGRESLDHLLPCLAGVDQLKFQQIVPPGTRVALVLEADAEGRSLRFTLTSNRGQHASGRMRFEPA